MERLLSGGSVAAELSEGLSFPTLTRDLDAVWSLLLAAGYLRPVRLELRGGLHHAELVVPNREVQVSWAEMASRGLRDALRGAGEVHRLTAAMLSGDEATFAHGLRQMTSNALSYHDVAGEWPERM